ncbi:hypothetical protein FA13DRAFT_638705 [Coprinellus micaceus]|uniref:Uncharacterized protein n=1 Tax=Coprinellus micaceus TaxID=71717 RepID=A0A4Y7SAN0_COPMI|nr:hypothetical protein FA13DRAFT_638705 [Coprinellus micaceus]
MPAISIISLAAPSRSGDTHLDYASSIAPDPVPAMMCRDQSKPRTSALHPTVSSSLVQASTISRSSQEGPKRRVSALPVSGPRLHHPSGVLSSPRSHSLPRTSPFQRRSTA